jgi:cytochrome P450
MATVGDRIATRLAGGLALDSSWLVRRPVVGINGAFMTATLDQPLAAALDRRGRRQLPPKPAPAKAILPAPLAIWALRRNMLATWGTLAYELPVVNRPFLGRQSILLNDPVLIRHVLVDNHDAYGRTAAGIRILEPITGKGLFLSEGAQWKRQRRLMAPAFAPRNLGFVAEASLAEAERYLGGLSASRRKAVDLLHAFQGISLEIACRVLLSQSMDSHGAALRRLITRYGHRHARPSPFDLLLPDDWRSPDDFGRQRFAREWRTLVDAIVAERAARPPAATPSDLFDAMRQATLESASGPTGGKAADAFGPEELRDQIGTLIVAGHETTALALFWSSYLLATHPEAQDALAVEAGAADLSPAGIAEAAHALPMARAVVSEALRLYPPAFTLVREARRPDRLGDVEVGQGAIVVIAPWVLHRHKQHWVDPDSFRPERFLPGATPPVRFTYLPFGAGPRVCIGAQFALTEAAMVLARLVRDCRIELVGRRPIQPVGVITIYPDRPPPFRLVPR